jgi:hypothetical protein
MRRRWLLWALLVVIGGFSFALTIPFSRFWLLGVLRRERLYNGMPAGYWINEIVDVKSINSRPLSLLDRVLSALGNGQPDGESWTPKQPCPAEPELLIEMMSDANTELRRRASFALEYSNSFPREAIPCLLVATQDTDARVRANAGLALLRSQELSPPMVAAIIALIQDKDPSVRQIISLSVPRGPASKALAPGLYALRKDCATFPVEAAQAIEIIEGSAAMEGGAALAQLRRPVGLKEIPVWCENVLLVSGPADSVKTFLAKAKGSKPSYARGGLTAKEARVTQVLCFHALYPIPEDILNADFDPNGYQWENLHWDCVGGAEGSHLESVKPGKANVVFRTAWGPPNAFFDKVAKDFPLLRFENKWKTPALGYGGENRWESGGNSKRATAGSIN